MKRSIPEEIVNENFCIIVDEAHDESKKEQMAIVLRFVDKDGFVQEWFFGLVHVSVTSTLTPKKGLFYVISYHNLGVENIQG